MLRFQDYIANATVQAAKEAFRIAKQVPADKLIWFPLDNGRSVLDQCRELAMTPTWAIQTLTNAMPEFNEETIAAVKAEQVQWVTVEQCEEECNKRLEELKQFFINLPDEKLSQTRWLPYYGGRDFTFVEMCEYAKWNFDYHAGQIAYIQTLYGDMEMH
jgi:hypothetical protein